MTDIQITRVEDIEAYSGPHAIEGIRFRHARQALGVTAWGMNIIEIDPHNTGYPEHDHVADEQEEVYVILSGAAMLRVDGIEHEVNAGQLVRVPPSATRSFITHGQGVSFLALGATPGKAYSPGAF